MGIRAYIFMICKLYTTFLRPNLINTIVKHTTYKRILIANQLERKYIYMYTYW